MLKVVLLLVVSVLLINGYGQTLNVYENDSIYRPEPLMFTETDSLEGIVTAKYKNYPNQVAFSANYYNHARSGFVRYYYPSGKIMMTQVFQRGKKSGEYTLYDEAGEIVIKGFYEENIKNGFWAYRKYKFMGEYANGLKNGKWKYISPNGKKTVYRYKKGILQKGKVVIELPQIPRYILNDGIVIAP